MGPSASATQNFIITLYRVAERHRESTRREEEGSVARGVKRARGVEEGCWRLASRAASAGGRGRWWTELTGGGGDADIYTYPC